MNSYNLDVYQGDTLALGLTIKDDDGAPMDLSSYGLRGTIKQRYTSATGVALVISLDVPESGVATVALSSTTTSELPVGQFVYDVEAFPVTGNADTFKVLKGYVNVYPEVTT